MIPESNIIAKINNLWIEKFPEGNDTEYPKGLVKRISTLPTREKDRSSTQYTTRISILYYDSNTISFDSIMANYLIRVRSLESETSIKNVNFVTRSDGYDPKTDKHVMNLEFLIKHKLN